MITWRSIAATTIVGFGLGSAPAAAAPMQAVYEGILRDFGRLTTYDQSGIFGNGTGAGALNGLALTATVLYDPDLGVRVSTSDANSATESSTGGGSVGPSFISSITITINGVTRNIGSGAYASLSSWDHWASDFSQHSLTAYDFTLDPVTSIITDFSYFAASVRDLAGVIPLDLNAEFVWDASTASASGALQGYLQIFDIYDPSLPDSYVNQAFGYIDITRATFTRRSVEPPPPPPVPLPASGLLLLGAALGIAGLGRRRAR